MANLARIPNDAPYSPDVTRYAICEADRYGDYPTSNMLTGWIFSSTDEAKAPLAKYSRDVQCAIVVLHDHETVERDRVEYEAHRREWWVDTPTGSRMLTEQEHAARCG